jgi:hypothetical protein
MTKSPARPAVAIVESLEARQFLSTTILGPSAVEGTYKGDAVSSSDDHSTELKLTITSTSATLTAVGVGSDKIALTAKQFKKLREGTFVFSGKIGVHVVTFDGSVTDKGERIAGTYTSKGSSNPDQNGPGTFVVKKG